MKRCWNITALAISMVIGLFAMMFYLGKTADEKTEPTPAVLSANAQVARFIKAYLESEGYDVARVDIVGSTATIETGIAEYDAETAGAIFGAVNGTYKLEGVTARPPALIKIEFGDMRITARYADLLSYMEGNISIQGFIRTWQLETGE